MLGDHLVCNIMQCHWQIKRMLMYGLRSARSETSWNLLAASAQVSLIGFEGERCVDDVEDNEHIVKYLLTNPFAAWPRALFLLWAPIKVLYQVRRKSLSQPERLHDSAPSCSYCS